MSDDAARPDASLGKSGPTDAERFIIACKSGDEPAARELLGKDSSLVNVAAEDVPLHYAVREGHERIVELLLEHGADPHSVTCAIWRQRLSTLDLAKARGFERVVALVEDAVARKHQRSLSDTPLRRALSEKDLRRIKAEVEHDPSQINTIDENGNTPLHRAAEAAETPETIEFLRFLLDHGAACDLPNGQGFTPVYLTLFCNRYSSTHAQPRWGLMELLLARGAPYDINLAAAKGDIACVAKLLAADAGAANFQAPCKMRPLSFAAEFGHREIVELLCAGADPNAQETDDAVTFPLVVAVLKNDLAIVQMLLEHGANPNAAIDGAEVALGSAIESGNREMADLIASYGGAQPVHCYAWAGDIVTLAAVLNENPSLALQAVYIPNPDKPKEAAQALRLALHHGLDPQQIGHWSLFRASGNADLLRAFLTAGANPNVTDGEGRTLLHYQAANSSAKASIRVLLEFGADINARDGIFRASPLTWAVIRDNAEMVAFFLENGASIDLPDDESTSTPRFWAEYLRREEILKLLGAAKRA